MFLKQSCADCRHGPIFDPRFPIASCEQMLAIAPDGLKPSTVWDCPGWQAPIKEA